MNPHLKALVVYDSFFNNTEQIAVAIAEGLWPGAEAEVLRVSFVRQRHLQDLDLLIVGSPTRGFRPTQAILNFIAQLRPDLRRSASLAAFDTRISTNTIKSGFWRFFVEHGGYAAKVIASWLRRHGGHLLVPANGFLVADKEGPLLPGELDRARAWGKYILEAYRAQQPARQTVKTES